MKCIDEEIPFEIPQGWEWCRLGNIGIAETGTTPQKTHPEYFGHTIPFIGPANILEDRIYCITQGLSEKGKQYGRIVPTNSILQVCIGGSIGKCAINKQPITFNQQINSITPIFCDSAYVHLVLQSETFRLWIMDKATGTATPIINRSNWESLFFPCPPLNEQKRIVCKYLSVKYLIDKYKLTQEDLDNLNRSLRIKIQKSILQEAIQGKLVPQVTEEGTAQELLEQIMFEKQKLVKEGKLKKSVFNHSVIYKGDDNKYFEKNGYTEIDITDEIPFEIPNSWSWVRLNDICSYIQRGKSPKYSPIKKYPVVAQKCNQWSGFSIDKAQFIDPDTLSSYGEERILQNGDLMWNSTGLGTLGRMAIYWQTLNPYELAVVDSHVTVIRVMKKFVLPQYLYYYFTSNTVQSVIEKKSDGSTKQKELATATVKNYIVPIPPLMEQSRIISKIKQLASIMSR